MDRSMEKLKMHTPDLIGENVEKIAALFPNCVTEATDENGKLTRAIDFDQLRQELSGTIVEGPRERYHLDWPGKREAILAANAPIAKTLRPCREESVDFDTTKNLFIEGDNLDALKLLQETYLGKVKLIYIDPPYNTGNDFVYKDDFSQDSASYLKNSNQQDEVGRLVANPTTNGRYHSDWLNMIYPRLRLARNLMRSDGLIFISIDEKEVHDLRLVCDEIFGMGNFISETVWKKAYGGGAKAKHIVGHHEYVLVYAREKELAGRIDCPPKPEARRYYKYRDEHFEELGPYRTQPLWTNSMDDRENLRYPITKDGEEIWPEKQWQWEKKRAKAAQDENKLEFVRSENGWSVYYKQYLYDEDGNERASKLVSVLDGPYTQVGTDELEAVFGRAGVFPFPKPSQLIERFISTLWKDDDVIVLDFFSGSGSSAQAVMHFNQTEGKKVRFIQVQLPESCGPDSEAFKAGFKTIAEIGKERIRISGRNLQQSLPRGNNGNAPSLLPDETPVESAEDLRLDTGFRVLKIDTSNMRDVYYAPDAVAQGDLLAQVDNIKPDRTPEDLLFQVLVDWGIDLALPIATETIAGKQVFFVDTNALAACFDAGLTDDMVKEIARRKPLRAVFRDASYGTDSVKINVDQIFKLLSPDTEVRSI